MDMDMNMNIELKPLYPELNTHNAVHSIRSNLRGDDRKGYQLTIDLENKVGNYSPYYILYGIGANKSAPGISRGDRQAESVTPTEFHKWSWIWIDGGWITTLKKRDQK